MHLNPTAMPLSTIPRWHGSYNESLLVPFVDSKGNFGKAYSRDMSCAAARYTEAKLEGVCEELSPISTADCTLCQLRQHHHRAHLLPVVTFPTILANTLGIAAWPAISVPSIWQSCGATTVALMKDEHHDIGTTMPAPDSWAAARFMMKRRCVKFTRTAAQRKSMPATTQCPAKI